MNPQQSDYCLVLVSAPSIAKAKEIATTLVETRLAACVAIAEIDSIDVWDGKINGDRKWQLQIKTKFDLFSQISIKIKSIHPDEVPEIIAVPITSGSQSYLDSIEERVKQLDRD